MSERAAKKVVDAWTERLAPLARAEALASWELNGSATEENAKRLEAARGTYEKAARDAEGFARVRRSLEEGVEDPLVRRSLEVLRNELLPFQGPAEALAEIVSLETRLEQTFSNVRGTVRGKKVADNEIAEILKTSDDVALREEAWRASKEVGAAAAPDLRRLVGLRNEVARTLGFEDHYALALARQEVDGAWLEGFLSKMEQATAGAYGAYKSALDARLSKRFGATAESLRPWHYEDPFFQEAPETGRPSLDPLFAAKDLVDLTRRTFHALGLDVGPALERSDPLPRAVKCQHAFCTHLDRSGDVRVLCNVRPDERWAGTMLHEYGHAIYDLEIDRRLPWTLRTPPHASSTEAIAMLFGRLSKDQRWLVPYLGLSKREAKAIETATKTAFAEGMLVVTRWVLVMTAFERALYADPARADLDALWWDLVERHQRVRRPDGRKAPDWAAKIHFAIAPVYYHSYLMGEAIASQVTHAIEKATGEGLVDNPAAGSFLRDRWFRPGSKERWDAHLSAATGGPLDPAILLADMGTAA